MGAQFTIPLVTVIPGQLIASSLWNNEFNNINTNFVPAGMDSYSDTDAQMQIQTNPFPGGVTSHATSLGGEIERLRFQLALAFGTTYWYYNPAIGTPTFSSLTAQTITANGAAPVFVVSLSGTPQAQFGVNSNDTVIYFGGIIGRLLFNIINTSTTVFSISPTAANFDVPLAMNSNKITGLTQGSNAADAICYPVTNAQMQPNTITAVTLGAIAGSGMGGGSGSNLTVNVDGATLDINGSNHVEVKAGGIGLTQLSAAATPTLTTGHVGTASGSTPQSVSASGRGRVAYILFNITLSTSAPWSVVLDGTTKASGTLPSSGTRYVGMDGSLNTSYTPFELDFTSSMLVSVPSAATVAITVGYMTP
jgi:hypothetical protein